MQGDRPPGIRMLVSYRQSNDPPEGEEGRNTMRRRASMAIPIISTFVLSLALILPTPGDAGADLSSPLFGVTVPEVYRQWPVVAPSHRPDKDEIRVIPGNDIPMKAYRAGTLPFPDGAILAKLAG